MNYAIGDVARTLGLTPGALHFFEREGVISPMKGDKTRRSYGAEDIIRLISYKKYRGMEMPLKEIARQFSPHGDDYATIAVKVKRQQAAALETAERYRRLAGDIAWFEQHITQGVERLGRVDVASLPECYVLRVGQDGFISRDREEQNRVAAWLEELPATRISVAADEDGTARFCYSVDVQRGQELGLDKTEGILRCGPQVALHTFVKVEKAYYDAPAMAFEPLWRYAGERGFRQGGMGLGVSLCVECQGEERSTLVEVWLPIG